MIRRSEDSIRVVGSSFSDCRCLLLLFVTSEKAARSRQTFPAARALTSMHVHTLQSLYGLAKLKGLRSMIMLSGFFPAVCLGDGPL